MSRSSCICRPKQTRHINVDFDVVDAGRAGEMALAVAGIMRYEVAPLQPDMGDLGS
jgi:hypothetical protein